MKPLLVVLAVGLLVYALIDCGRTPAEAVPSSLPRAGWYVVMVLLPIVGPVFWLIASRSEGERRNPGGRGPGSGPGRPRGTGPTPKGPTRPIGPDDDPDFLHGL